MNNKWYVIYSEGRTVTECIIAGPFAYQSEAERVVSMARLENCYPIYLDSNKVERHLAEDKRLTDWLRNHDCF